MLGQRADFAPNRSDRLAMLCEIGNQRLIFSDLDDRWLVPNELLVLQGWPIYKQLKDVIDIACCFDSPRAGRNPARVLEQAGNSIPRPLMTLALLYCLWETDLGRGVTNSSNSQASASESAPALTRAPESRKKRTLREVLSATSEEP